MITFIRSYAICFIAYLPLFALLLVPQLMRSRAGSEQLLMIGSSIFVVLCVAVFLLAPRLNAIALPHGTMWRSAAIRKTLSQLRHSRPAAYWLRFAEFWVIFVLVQSVGMAIAAFAPYVYDNPAFGADPAVRRWIIDYPNYFLQASVIYVGICFAAAWYGTRLRNLVVRSSKEKS